MLGMSEPPRAALITNDTLELVVGFERVATGGDKRQHAFPHRLVYPGVGQVRTHFR